MIHKSLIIFIIITSSSIFADPKGEEVALTIEKNLKGYLGESSQMKMLLYDAQGKVITRQMNSKIAELSDGGKKGLLIFTLPRDVKGTKLLTWSEKNVDDSQWLYLKSLRRVKRIISSAKRSSFMGSEFSYEDFGSQQREKFTHNLISEDKETWTIEKFPKSKGSGYFKQIVTINKEMSTATKVQYFNLRKKLFKEALFSNFIKKEYKKKIFYRAQLAIMKNLLTRRKSEIIWDNIDLGVTHSLNIFTPGKLK